MRMLFAAFAVLVAACAEGKDLTFEETQAYFQKHAGDLLHVIELVEACRPVYRSDGGYNGITLDDRGAYNPTCANGGASRIEEIKTAMRKAVVLHADVRLTSDGKASYAAFSLYSAGLSVSGVGVDVIYYADLNEVTQPPYEEGYQLKPLGVEADHWFWQRLET